MKSLGEAHRSIAVPDKTGSFLAKLLAFSGPGYLVAVGYMDPGNWATDLAGGAKYGYALLFIVLLSNVFAMCLQYLAVKLGVATGRDLAQICHETFPRAVNLFLWLMAEVMIIACDLAEVIGTAIGLQLLFHIPLPIGVLVTACDVLVLLLLQKVGFRYLEALIITLISIIVLCFGLEVVFSRPDISLIVQGVLPTRLLFTNRELLFIAVGIIGATVMPHNLYLHSSAVQTRAHGESPEEKREAIKFGTVDSTIALTIALLVNTAILIVAAAAFHFSGHSTVADITTAYRLLVPLLGVGVAGTVFAIALLASGQNSTITATLAGQIILEGYLHIHVKPWIRRLITRSLAIIPACIIVVMRGASSLTGLLIFSQVVLSMQLPFAVIPLVIHTSSKKRMGEFTNTLWTKYAMFVIAGILTGLNIWLVFSSFTT
ncbi:MAG TPA: Nramp family divalent metal transporter [Verrucomicrobiae bacterium]|nr:Nramp family divalent metal transporter [Verrucomicrobiae bacterium]